MKKVLILGFFLITVMTLTACDGDTSDTPQLEDDELREFTLEELSEYDGLEGRDAYVAVDGYVYDVTNSSYWIDGVHQGRIQAGQDLTEEISDSPHGLSALSKVPKIGTLVDE